ncbi:MAG: class I SAM-dependent methyltransferase [Actinomycetota bacterium]|nr:class I SAM-dependent methyltransferase [Actinomycetota bacterium]
MPLPDLLRRASGLRQRHRFRDPVAVKNDAQLRWWVQEWDPVLRAGGLNPSDAAGLLSDAEIAPTYLGRRRQQARAEVIRVMREAAIEDETFFHGRVVVDVGPGPLGFPDLCPARVSIGVDPLAERYAESGLLLPDSPALYLSCGAEQLPLVSASADVVLARNSLDYVESPEQVLREARRILRPGGTLIALFDVDSVPTPREPHRLTVARIRAAIGDMTVVRERRWDQPFATDGHRAIIVAQVPAS